jgi:cell division septation protein DedD
VPAFKNNGAYVVQVATMVSRWLADELATELKEKGYPAYVSEVQNPREDLQGTYYRVRIGSFASVLEAKAFGDNVLIPASYTFWVDRKSNDNAPSRNRQTPISPSSAPVPAPATASAPASTPSPAPQSGESTGGSSWNDKSGTW